MVILLKHSFISNTCSWPMTIWTKPLHWFRIRN